MRNDKITPYELATAYQYDSPEYGSDRIDSPGENRDRALVINSEGGDVTIGPDVLRSNRNTATSKYKTKESYRRR